MRLFQQILGFVFVWCLTLFHISREAETVQKAEEEKTIFVSEGSWGDPGDPPNNESFIETVPVRNLRDFVVMDPGIVKALPLPVLNKIVKDPLFSVNVVQNMTEEIRMLLKRAMDDQEDKDYVYSEDLYFDVDYEDYVGNFLEGLDPSLLASISPDLLVAYFESATAENVKSILADSTILISLPPKTVVELLNKLPEETVTTIVNSDAVQSLYSSVQGSLGSEEEFGRAFKWRGEVVSELIAKVEAERLAALPDFLIFSQLEDVAAVAALLNHPEKLTLLASTKPLLVEMVSLPRVVEALQDCDLLANLTLSPSFPTLAAAIPHVITDVLALKPSLVECIPDSSLLHLAEPSTIAIFTDHVLSTVLVQRPNIVAEIPSETLAVTVQSRPVMVVNLPEEILGFIIADRPDVLPLIPDEELVALLKLKPSFLDLVVERLPFSQLLVLLSSRPQLLHSLPPSADAIISNLLEDRRHKKKLLKLMQAIPASILATLASTRPAIVANLPEEILILIIANRQDMLTLLSDKDLVTLLYLNPNILSSIVEHLSSSHLLLLLSSRPQLLSLLPPSADDIISNLLKKKRHEKKLLKLIKAMPARILATLASSRPWLIANIPSSALESLVVRADLLPLLEDHHLLNLISFRPSLLYAFAELIPAEKLSPILRSRPVLIERLPPSAKPILSSLLLQKSFLKKLPLPLVIKLASSPTILGLVTKFSLIQVLSVYPTLPSHLDISSLLPLLHHVEDPWFRARIPCLAVISLVQKPSLLSSLPPSVLESVLTSRRLLACLPSSLLEQVAATQDLGLEDLPLPTLLAGVMLLPKDRMTAKMLKELLTTQAPGIARELIIRRGISIN